MTHNQFTTKYNGRPLEYNHDIYPNQCMDLFWAYQKEVQGLDTKPYQGWGSAKNLWNNLYRVRDFNKNYAKILNTPTNSPKKGDIIFWGTYPFITGLAGHVAICEGAGMMDLISFDQNWPTRSLCHFQKHSYKGVLGWISRK